MSDYDWLCCIQICDGKKEYFLVNVYLSFESYENMDNDCLAKLNVSTESINSTCITVVGDFNANLAKQTMFGEILQSYCTYNSLIIVDKESDTYVSSALDTISWLDHVVCCMLYVVCTYDAKDCITDVGVMYACILSDPVLCTVTLSEFYLILCYVQLHSVSSI